VRDLAEWPSSANARPQCSASARAPKTPPKSACSTRWVPAPRAGFGLEASAGSDNTARQVMRKRLREGALDDKEIEIELAEPRSGLEIMTPPGMEGWPSR